MTDSNPSDPATPSKSHAWTMVKIGVVGAVIALISAMLIYEISSLAMRQFIDPGPGHLPSYGRLLIFVIAFVAPLLILVLCVVLTPMFVHAKLRGERHLDSRKIAFVLVATLLLEVGLIYWNFWQGLTLFGIIVFPTVTITIIAFLVNVRILNGKLRIE